MSAPIRDDTEGVPMQQAGTDSRPSALEWVLAVFAVIIQLEGAFVSVPMMLGGDSSALWGSVNPLNTAGIAVSIASIGIACAPRIRHMGHLALQNVSSVLFMLMVAMSAIWSIHPDRTIRGATGYVLTLLIAGYLSVRFARDDRMKVLSWGFALSAISSLLFVAAFPQYGIMQESNLSGAWRGIFPHKNVLGPVMAVAVFTELYILVSGNGRPRWRFALLGIFLGLVVLSQSATAWAMSLLYLAGACLYLLWKRTRLAAVVAAINGVLLVLVLVLVLWSDPTSVLASIGKDVTLTGRTALWDLVISDVHQSPLLGWGYRATWQVDDPITILANRLVFNWGVTSSHNGFLEITLQLGLTGLGLLVAIIGVALWRGYWCCRAGRLPLGWFSVIFFGGAILAAQTIETLGRNQSIVWLVFNMLSFSCGLDLALHKQTRLANTAGPRIAPRWREG